MILPASHSIARHSLSWIGAVILLLVSPTFAMAGISLGPNTNDNPAEAEQRRIAQFYEAQKSNQEKLKVGQQRFEQKKVNRAKLLAAMTAELAVRQETVTLQAAVVPNVEKTESSKWAGNLLGGGVVGLGFLGFRYYLGRQEKKNVIGRNV
ncbi:MAG: hypothetical protein WDM80_09965 [Limisphaerales bacterium]